MGKVKQKNKDFNTVSTFSKKKKARMDKKYTKVKEDIGSLHFIDDKEVKVVKKKYVGLPSTISEEEAGMMKNEVSNLEGALSSLWVKYKQRSTHHIEAGSDWISQLIPEDSGKKPISFQIRKQLQRLAEKIYEDDLRAYNLGSKKRNNSQGKNATFHKAVFSHGTTKDKIAALTYQCMEFPAFCLNDLASLIDFVSPKVKGSCQEAVEAIGNLFRTTLLPNEYPAKEFACHDFLALLPLLETRFEEAEKQLSLWYFEGQVRLAYLTYIDNLEKLCQDTQQKTKTLGIKGLYYAVRNHPLQDPELVLRKMVNKLGDVNKVSGDIIHALSNLQVSFPTLKLTIVALTEEVLYRPNISQKAQYFGLCFLKDIIFKDGEERLALRLIKLYFDFFKTCSKAGEVHNRFMAAILRGLNRAYPYVEKKNLAFIEDQMSMMFKLAHSVNFNIASQILQLIYQVQNYAANEPSDRFYFLLYSKIFDPSFGASTADAAFLNIIFKSMKKDSSAARFCAFVRRLLQVCKYQAANAACGVLFLVSEAIRYNPHFKDLDSLVQRRNKKLKNSSKFENDDDDFEYYPDLDTDEQNEDTSETRSLGINGSTEGSTTASKILPTVSPVKNEIGLEIKSEPSWVHRDNAKSINKQEIWTKAYDPQIWNPLFCGAHLSPIWELQELKFHFHPTVAQFASNILSKTKVEYDGDPLIDFSLTRFLDRFTYRTPMFSDKQKMEHKNETASILGPRSLYSTKGKRSLPVVGQQFKNLTKRTVAVEDVFLHNYFTKYRKNVQLNEKKTKNEELDDDEADDVFEQFIKKTTGYVSDDEDDIDEALDFSRKKARRSKDDENGSEEEASEMESEDDEDEGDDDMFEDDEENEDLLSDDDEIDDFPSPIQGKRKAGKSHGDMRNMLVDEEDFLDVLEDNAETADPFAGTSEAVSNKDNASAKQLQWERQHTQSLDRKGRRGAFEKSTSKPFEKRERHFKGSKRKSFGKKNIGSRNKSKIKKKF